MPDEKRQSQRVEFHGMVQVKVLHSSRNSIFPTNLPASLKAKNLGEDGICLETDGFIMPDQVMELDFTRPSGEAVHARAIVIWSEEKTCGLFFLG